jgi:hypothetical protein
MKISKIDVYAGMIAMLIVLYIWSLSTPGALAMAAVSPSFFDTGEQAIAAPLIPPTSSASKISASASASGQPEGMLDQALMPVWYLSAFFIGGVSITMLQDKNKSQRGNDLLGKLELS